MKTKKSKEGYLVFDDERERFVHRWVAEKNMEKTRYKEKKYTTLMELKQITKKPTYY